MKFQKICAGVLLAAGMSVATMAAASAPVTSTAYYGQFVVEFDPTTDLGSPSFASGGSNDIYGFGWYLPSSIQAISVSGAAVSATFQLPNFTITAKPGWVLNGPVSSFLGNVVFNEVGPGAQTAMTAIADVAIDGAVLEGVGGALSRIETSSSDAVRSGYFSGKAAGNPGSYTSLTISNASLTLLASGGTFASIIAQPQNFLEFSVTAVAAPVPEPEAWALLVAGLGLIAAVTRRRSAGRR